MHKTPTKPDEPEKPPAICSTELAAKLVLQVPGQPPLEGAAADDAFEVGDWDEVSGFPLRGPHGR